MPSERKIIGFEGLVGGNRRYDPSDEEGYAGQYLLNSVLEIEQIGSPFGEVSVVSNGPFNLSDDWQTNPNSGPALASVVPVPDPASLGWNTRFVDIAKLLFLEQVSVGRTKISTKSANYASVLEDNYTNEVSYYNVPKEFRRDGIKIYPLRDVNIVNIRQTGIEIIRHLMKARLEGPAKDMVINESKPGGYRAAVAVIREKAEPIPKFDGYTTTATRITRQTDPDLPPQLFDMDPDTYYQLSNNETVSYVADSPSDVLFKLKYEHNTEIETALIGICSKFTTNSGFRSYKRHDRDIKLKEMALYHVRRESFYKYEIISKLHSSTVSGRHCGYGCSEKYADIKYSRVLERLNPLVYLYFNISYNFPWAYRSGQWAAYQIVFRYCNSLECEDKIKTLATISNGTNVGDRSYVVIGNKIAVVDNYVNENGKVLKEVWLRIYAGPTSSSLTYGMTAGRLEEGIII